MISLKISIVIVVCCCCLNFTSGIIGHHLPEALDFSNLDLVNYQYFKNVPSKNPKTAANANHFLEHFQKKKAVIDYFENLFFGNSIFTQESNIEFNPHFGKAWRPYFEHHYGKRGERLIELLGKGASLQKLRYHGAIPKEFDRPIYYY